MSNRFAPAAVTRTLRNLLSGVVTEDYSELPDDARPTGEIQITTLPIDRIRNGESPQNQLNLFLYHTEPNQAYRNMDLPNRVRPGETASPPLALDLYYLLTAYGEGDSELVAHALLGTAMQILHDHPVLGREEIRDALAASELDVQFERLRVTPQPLSLEDISRIWAGGQSEYRLSAAYHVSVVLIESRRPHRSPLPVLRRGEEDRGPVAVAGPAPALLRVEAFLPASGEMAPGKPSAELGDILVLAGTNVSSEGARLRFRHPLLDTPLELSPLPGGSTSELRVALPAAAEPGIPAAWPPGFYTVELVVDRPGVPAWTTNRIGFALAPVLGPLAPPSAPVGSQPFDLTVTALPQVREEQRPILLVGAREILPTSVTTPPDPDASTTAVFPVDELPPGPHVVRVRVDGADSIPVDFTAEPPAFDADQTLEVTP